MELIQYKCPNCGGDLRLDPKTQKYKCNFCGSLFDPQEIEKMVRQAQQADEKETSFQETPAGGPKAPAQEPADDKKASAQETPASGQKAPAQETPVDSKKAPAQETPADGQKAPAQETSEDGGDEAVLYHCPSCGAQIVTEPTTTATFCYYCHNPVVLAGRLQGGYHPDGIIPFAITREQALTIFHQWIRGKKYLPKGFYSQDQIEKMSGVYFPYWLYSCQVEGELEAQATRIKTWVTGRMQYTRTESFRVIRDGEMEVKNVARDALSKADHQLAQSVLPYDLDKMQPFQMGYLSGFQAENRDMEKEQFSAQVEQEVQDYAADSLRNQISGYDTVQIRANQIKLENPQWRYGLLPVWTLTYRDPKSAKMYYFACNGQTGNVCGKLPVDPLRLAGLFASIFVPMCAVLLVLGYFLG